jgi:ketosteroid isomerase-like protein
VAPACGSGHKSNDVWYETLCSAVSEDRRQTRDVHRQEGGKVSVEEDNIEVVKKYCETMGNGQFDGLSEECTFWIAGKNIYGGTLTKAQMKENLGAVLAQLDGEWRYTPFNFVAQGNQVAVEAVSRARFKDGREYSNEYFALYEVQNGEIIKVREYNDTAYTMEFFGGAST